MLLVRAEVAQLVEQRTENPRVGSSILPLGTIFWAGVAQLVERITRNDEVRGSTPRSSSMLKWKKLTRKSIGWPLF